MGKKDKGKLQRTGLSYNQDTDMYTQELVYESLISIKYLQFLELLQSH